MDGAVPEIDIDALEAMRADGTVVLDVRELDEWQAVRIPGVLHIPLTELVERVDEVPTGTRLPVVCAAGGRSLQAAEYLRSRDIDAINVAGGTNEWAKAGKATESGV